MIENPFNSPIIFKDDNIIHLEPAPGGEAPPITKALEEDAENLKVKEEPEHIKILHEHGNQESNIPINHKYWRIRP